MDMKPGLITATELKAIGYIIEEHIEEYWQGPVLNEAYYFRVIAPDGQLIADGLTDPLEAWGHAREHFTRAPDPADGDVLK